MMSGALMRLHHQMFEQLELLLIRFIAVNAKPKLGRNVIVGCVG